ncbi:transglutaminase family protein [Nakamurella silvestris]|nr:transglutaminase family protein [Nakamurella silvestris]
MTAGVNGVDLEATGFWRLAITHKTVLTYPDTVTTSYNEVRIQPVDEPGQTVLSSRLDLDPYEGIQVYTDYFGTRVSAFDLHRPHRQLTFTANTTVETFARALTAAPMSWADLSGSECEDRFEEYLTETELTTVNEELTTIAAELREGSDGPSAAGKAICDWVNRTLTYETGSTGIHTSAIEAYDDRRGVCQDFSHLAIGMLRSIGVPARYVSGYLHPEAAAEIGRTVTGESHAWVEWFDGEWRRYDPTHAAPITLGHVVAGRGRDYRDTPPVRGVYAGPEAIGNDVVVQVTRLR